MRIGVGVGSFGGGDAGIDSQVEQSIIAEADGFHSAWFTHIRGADSLISVALAGQATSTIELVTGVIPVYSREPLLMAQQALTANSVCNGRLTLGIGLAHPESVPRTWNHTYERPAHFMYEYLSVLQPLLNEQTVEFSGEMISTSASLELAGVAPPSVLLAALAPRMLRMAAELADGTLLWVTGPKTIRTHIAPRLAEAAKAAGRPRSRIVAALPICVTDEPDKARERVARGFSRYGQLVNYRRVLDIEGVEGPQNVAIVGNEAEVEAQLRDLADAGATDYFAAFVTLARDDSESIPRTRELLKGLIGKI
ncbi:MAG: TIGR03564 family F420-dependent LLM class oxidoreductase [Chloroflexi bacterium]|nr:TIGR03564 family F420-dependent LLM class oxidoreductase [Chloroflexota bacterium]